MAIENMTNDTRQMTQDKKHSSDIHISYVLCLISKSLGFIL